MEHSRGNPVRGRIRNSNIDAERSGWSFALATFAIFGMRGPRIFKLARDFGHALAKVRCDISPKYLRFDDEIYCIEFPDDLAFDMQDGDRARSAYVGMYTRQEAMAWPNGVRTGKWMMDITVPLYSADGSLCAYDNVCLPLDEDDDLHEALEAAIHSPLGRTGMSHELLSYIVNALLYINSGDPDLRHLRPTPRPRHRNPKKAIKLVKAWREDGGDLFCPITLVGFDYKKPRVYAEGDSIVNGHWRWQPCGVGRTQVRLTWIREHTRTYRNRNEPSDLP